MTSIGLPNSSAPCVQGFGQRGLPPGRPHGAVHEGHRPHRRWGSGLGHLRPHCCLCAVGSGGFQSPFPLMPLPWQACPGDAGVPVAGARPRGQQSVPTLTLVFLLRAHSPLPGGGHPRVSGEGFLEPPAEYWSEDILCKGPLGVASAAASLSWASTQRGLSSVAGLTCLCPPGSPPCSSFCPSPPSCRGDISLGRVG